MSLEPPIMGPTTPETLRDAVWGGTRTVALAGVASQLITIGTLAVLFRQISPSAYGLVGMILPVLFFLRIFTKLGLNVATVQRADVSREEISTLFWLNMLLGAATMLATALLAPALAWFYNEPRLMELTVVMAGLALAAAFGAQHQALLERRMRLGRLAACRVGGQVCASIAAIAAALAGWNVWALVVQQYTEAIVSNLLAWLVEPWRPGRPSRQTSIAAHLRFGGYYSASSVMFFLAGNLDKVLIGRWLGEHALGLYSQAFNLMLKPVVLVTDPLTGVMLSALSRAADDPQQREQLLVSVYRIVAIGLFPAAIGLALVGDQALAVLGGPQWSDAGPLIAVLGLAVFGQGFINVAGPIFTAAGRTDRMFVGSIGLTVVLAAGYLGGGWIGGQVGAPLMGVAWGYVFALLVVLLVPYTLYCLWSADYTASPIFQVLWRPAVAALAMGAIVWGGRELLAPLPIGVQLLLEVLLGVVSYLCLARGEIRWLLRETSSLARSR